MPSRKITTDLDCTGISLLGAPTIIAPSISSFVNSAHDHQTNFTGGQLTEAAVSLSDVTTLDVSTSKHGLVPKAPNNAGKVLGGLGTWADAPLVLLSTANASSSATIDITSNIDSTFKTYLVRIRNLLPATNAVTFHSRITTDGGSTWKSGASDYICGEYHVLGTGAAGGTGSTGTSLKLISGANSGSQLSNVSGRVGFFDIFLLDPSNSSNFFTISGSGMYQCADTATYILNACFFGGRYATAGAINGIRFYMSSGNISAGQFDLYGVR
jgi:hypothetical protein